MNKTEPLCSNCRWNTSLPKAVMSWDCDNGLEIGKKIGNFSVKALLHFGCSNREDMFYASNI